MRKDTAADRVFVLVGTAAVSIVVVGVVGDARAGVVGRGVGVARYGVDGGNHPTGNGLVVRVVAGAYVVVIGQLYLVVVVVEAVEVLVGAL